MNPFKWMDREVIMALLEMPEEERQKMRSEGRVFAESLAKAETAPVHVLLDRVLKGCMNLEGILSGEVSSGEQAAPIHPGGPIEEILGFYRMTIEEILKRLGHITERIQRNLQDM